MSNFTPNVSHVIDFEGDTINVSIKRLKRKDMMRLAKYMEVDEAGNVAAKINVEELLDIAADLVPEYVVAFTGLTGAGGQPISIETVVEESYFLPVLTDLVTQLFAVSGMKAEDEKNSGGQPSTL